MARLTRFQRSKQLCPNLPWCNDSPERLGPVVTQFVFDQENIIRRWARRWFENFSYIFGNSTLRWSKKHDFAVDVDFLSSGGLAVNQRASTNISSVVLEALGSLIYSSLPSWVAEAAEESSMRGKRFAGICQRLLDAYMERLCMEKEFSSAALSYIAFAQIAARIDWDPLAGMMIQRPRYRKTKAPVFTDYMAMNQATGGLMEVPIPALNSMGQPYFEDRWEPVVDDTGRQVIDRRRLGDVCVNLRTPFEYRREIGSAGMHKTKYVEDIQLLDYDEWLRKYDPLGGKTRFFNHIRPGFSSRGIWTFATQHFLRMQVMSPPTLDERTQPVRFAGVFGSSLFRNKVLVIEHFDRPDDEMWPQGRRLIVANGQCTHITIPQYYTNKLDGWHPYVEAQWRNLRPSSISAGPMDAVTAKNRELNVFDSLIATAARRNMGSQLLVKTASGFDPNRMSGEPGQHHMVNTLDAARYLHDEMPIPPSIPTLRNSLKDDVYEVSGAQDSLRGDRSKGVSSGYAYRQLQEREERRLTPARKGFELFGSGIGEKIIVCLKQNVIRLDDDIMGYLMRKGAGEFQASDVIAFLSNPGEYGIDVKIEPGTMVERSKATRQANYLELARGPAQQRIMSNAQVLDRFLKVFDAEMLRDGSAAHRDRADRENEIFADIARLGPDSAGLKTPLVLLEDDDNIHMDSHADFLIRNSEEIVNNEFYLQQILLHVEQHRMQLQEKQGQALPGAHLAAPQMMAMARQTLPPGIPQIYQSTMQIAQDKLEKQAAGTPVQQKQAPQAASTPAPAGSGGPPQTTTGAPSGATPTATVQGGPPQ